MRISDWGSDVCSSDLFNAVVGREARAQMLAENGRLPDAVTAWVGGGSNAIGIFHAFLNDPGVRIVGAEAAGEGIASGRHAASRAAGRVGVLHGNRTYVLCDDDGQVTETHSVSAGLDYPGVGPEHAFLKDQGRAEYVGVTDEEALAAFHLLARTEGILPALESSHAIAQALKLARGLPPAGLVLCNLSGRGASLPPPARAPGPIGYALAGSSPVSAPNTPFSGAGAWLNTAA